MSRANEWDAAYRMAGEIPTCTSTVKHRMISALLTKLIELLRGAAWN